MRSGGGEEHLSPLEERALIVDALNGNQRSMRALIARVSQIVLREAARALFRMRMLGGAGYSLSVEDLRQEILVLLFADSGKKLNAFDPNLGSLRAYVSPIARRRLVSYLKRQAGSGRAEVPTEAEAFVAVANVVSPRVKHVLIMLLEALRAELSEQNWRTFIEIFVEEKTAREAANRLGASVTAIHLRAWKIRRRARILLRELMVREGLESGARDEVMSWLGALAEERNDS